MDHPSVHEGSFKGKRLSAADYERVVALMSQEGRRAFVEVDGHKLDVPEDLTPSRVAGARAIDISSYWSDPARPHWGRRHFVYLVADRVGVRYFGDSDSPEVLAVCERLGQFLAETPGHTPSPAPSAPSWFDGPFGPLHPSGWREPWNGVPAWAVLTTLGVLLFLVAFLLSRASVGPDLTPLATPSATPDAATQPL